MAPRPKTRAVPPASVLFGFAVQPPEVPVSALSSATAGAM